MLSPKPALPVAVATLALLCLASAATTGTYTDLAVRGGMPKYDPKARTEEPPKETPVPVNPHPLKRLSDPYARLPEVKIVPGAPVTARAVTGTNKDTLILPKMTVNGPKEKTPSLPRLFVQPPARDLPAQPFESPAARNARLVRKHINPFDHLLNQHPLPLIGGSLLAKAEAAEAREISATQLNNIADLLELSLLTGTETLEEQKKLRAEYLNALTDRPR